MAVQLVLTEEIIECFHFCAKKADYQQLFNDYPRFFVELVENLEKVKFPDGIWQTIAKNSRHLLDILKQWHSENPLFRKEILAVEEKNPEFLAHFKDFGSVKDWNDFYNEYKSTADLMITHARKKGNIDFRIECKGASFGNFAERDNFLKSQKETKPEPRATPRRRTRVIDDNSWLTRASTPDNNDDAPQLTEQSPQVPEKTGEEHTPKLEQTITSHEFEAVSKSELYLNSDPNVAHVPPQATPRRRNRIIDDSSWLSRASTPDTNNDAPQSTVHRPKIPEKTDEEHTLKLKQITSFHELETALKIDSNVALANGKKELLDNLKLQEETANPKKSNQEISHKLETPLESGCFQKTLNIGSNIALVNENEEPLGDQLLEETANPKKSCQENPHKAETPLAPLRFQSLQEISDLKRIYQEKLEQLEKSFELKFEQHEQETRAREQEMTANVADLTEKLLQLNERQEEFEEKSKMLRENDDINRQHLENRIQKQLKAQEEQMKLRENELKQRLEKKLQEFLETIKLTVRNSAGENGEKSRQQLEDRIQEQLKAQEEQMKLREDKLKMREQELDEKVNEIRSMEEHLGMKVDEIRSGEENLRRKMEKMMDLMIQNTATVGTASPGTQVTSPVQDSSIDTSRNEASAPHSDPTDDIVRRSYQADEPTSEDEEIQQIEEQFQKAKAEQDRVYGEKLRLLQEQRREKNEKAAEEMKRLSGSLTRGASFRNSFHS
ncbi:unnamed protein product [Caenorhabditis brenneri]